MTKAIRKNITLIILITVITTLLSSCHYSKQEREYYAQRDNYLSAVGVINKITFSDENESLYLDLASSEPSFGDTCFKIVGDSYGLILERGIRECLQVGQEVEFIAAPMIFGDGYVMPMVAISIDGSVFLEFEEGFANLQKWTSP